MDSILNPFIDKPLTTLMSYHDIRVDTKTILDTKSPSKSPSNSLNNTINLITNWDKIKQRYSAQELIENEPLYPTGAVLVKAGTELFIFNAYIGKSPIRNIAAQLKADLSKLTSFKPFMSRKLVELLKDPNYTRISQSLNGLADSTLDNNGVTVYIWCRALSKPGDTGQAGDWINVSDFVQSISTQVTGQVGAFNFLLPSIPAEWFAANGWTFDSSVYGQSTQTSIVKQDPKTLNTKRETFLFNTILQENDLVYIKMEHLVLDNKVKRGDDLTVAGGVWDMIGLIDNVSVQTTPSASSVSVQGRDMTKLLIEDGSIFMPEQFGQIIFTDAETKLAKRNRFELQLQYLASSSYTFKTVETILQFIFNKFSNIGIVPSSVFNGYGTDATKSKFQLKTSELTKLGTGNNTVELLNDEFLKEERQGCWRICNFIFDPAGSKRVLADNNISQDSGSIINSIRKFCQEPFVEFYGDTYKDQYYWVIRKQPFDREGYTGLVYSNYVVDEPPIVSATTVDDGVGGIGFVKKIIKARLNGPLPTKSVGGLTEKVKNKIAGRVLNTRLSTLSDLVIDIDDNDVLSEPQFMYQNDEAYSWYRIIPRGLGILPDAAMLILAPVMTFDEYAEVWGNKTFSIEYNYCPVEVISDDEDEQRKSYWETQTFYDLQFLIQSHQYLPFTRKGTIILTGNRTIKRGTFVYYKPTKEVFYVDSVSHNRTFGNASGQNVRMTILQVSRGMREAFVKGKWILFGNKFKLVSYFDIIYTRITNDASISDNGFLKNWKVDSDVFNFFIQRRQWVD